MEDDYKVRLEVFEGPLDLLLFLIKREEVDIYEVSIERITQQYLAYVETFRMLDLDLAGEFIVMAATLIYIKSRSLLPIDQQPLEEDVEEEDPRWELLRQLIEYKKFKEVAQDLQQRGLVQESMMPRFGQEPIGTEPAALTLSEVGVFDLIHAFHNVLRKLEERKEDLREIFAERFQVADKIELILQITALEPNVLFSQLFADSAGRTEIVVTFLALLELIRLKQIQALQPESFGEIALRRVAN